MAENWKAKGHIPLIWKFNDETVMMPLSNLELQKLIFCLEQNMEVLEKSGDYPEKTRDKNLLDNLKSGEFLLCTLNKR